MIPREHGAWSMLLAPFAGALALARQWDWSLLPAAAAMVTVFLMRAPLTVLARQRFVWREPREESAVAGRWLLWELLLLAAAGLMLLKLWPWPLVAAFGGASGVLTAAAVWMTVKNRQRSVALQTASACGLAASALAVSVSATGGIREWAVWLWLLCTLHSVASILVVHARLETRIAARAPGKPVTSLGPAWAAQGVLLAGAAGCFAVGRWWPGAALALSAAVHVRDLRNLSEPAPLRTVGLRALALSLVFTAVVVAGLWRVA